MAPETLGSRLRHLRHSREMTLAALASSAQVSVSYLNDIEHDRTVPSLGKLTAIAEALHVSVRDVLKSVSPYDGPHD